MSDPKRWVYYFTDPVCGGPDQMTALLGGVSIEPGGEHVIYDVEPGYYDVKAVDADGESVEVLYNVGIFGEQEWLIVSRSPLPDNAVLRFEDDFRPLGFFL